MGDGKVYLIRKSELFSFALESGKRIGEHGSCYALHSLPGGRALFGFDKHYELRDENGMIARLEVAAGRSRETVIAAGEDRYLLSQYHSRGVHELRRTGEKWGARRIDTWHTKNLSGGGVTPLDDGSFVTHVQTMPRFDEQFGFDGTLRCWDDSFASIGQVDLHAPILQVVALPRGRAAVLVRDPLRGKEISIVDARKAKLATTLKGPKKVVTGALWVPHHGLLAWSADKATRLYAIP
jgi:hypothetical protein